MRITRDGLLLTTASICMITSALVGGRLYLGTRATLLINSGAEAIETFQRTGDKSDLERALRIFEKTEGKSKWLGSRGLYDYLHNYGTLMDMIGISEEALRFFDKALEINPNDPETLSQKSQALLKCERYKEAMDILGWLKEAKKDPLNTLDFQLGMAFAGLGKYDEAIRAYQAHIEKHPEDSSTAHRNMGNIYMKTGSYDSAISYYERVPEKSIHDFVAAQMNMGGIYAKRKQFEEAIKCLSRIRPDSGRGKVKQRFGTRGMIT